MRCATARGGYERVRLLASLTFAIGAIGAGFLYDQTGYDAELRAPRRRAPC